MVKFKNEYQNILNLGEPLNNKHFLGSANFAVILSMSI